MSTRPVLVLGGRGMLGHKLAQVLRSRMDTWVTVRNAADLPPEIVAPDRVIAGVDAFDASSIERAIAEVKPAAVINCIGIVKQLAEAKDPIPSITVNALLPHLVHAACARAGCRVIHVSTDCVFDGARGGYREADAPDATDLYGRSKLLGEITDEGALTLRTSIIGRELRNASGVVEWFLANRGGRVDGYTRAVFSGVTTAVLASLIGDIIEQHPYLCGLYHVAAAPITKHDLLTGLNLAFAAGIDIVPSEAVVVDRSLDGSRLSAATGWRAPAWDEMIDRLGADPTPYQDWRQRVS